MDTKSTIIGLIIALICCSPFIIISYTKRKQKAILINSLKALAKKNNAEINEFEIFNNAIIAVDYEKKMAFFIKNEQSTVIDLNNTDRCYLSVNKKPIKNSKQEIVISAEICFKQSSLNERRFNLYDDDIDPPFNGEIPFSEKWINTFNKQIKRAA